MQMPDGPGAVIKPPKRAAPLWKFVLAMAFASCTTAGAIKWRGVLSDSQMTTTTMQQGFAAIDAQDSPKSFLATATGITAMSIAELSKLVDRDDDIGRSARTQLSRINTLVRRAVQGMAATKRARKNK